MDISYSNEYSYCLFDEWNSLIDIDLALRQLKQNISIADQTCWTQRERKEILIVCDSILSMMNNDK
jgi:hypothetical protein